MPIKLNGATNGSVELDVPAAVGSDLQITLPATAGTAIVKAADGSVDLGSVDIDSSGNLGIATSSPNQRLTVGAGSGPEAIVIQSGSGNTGELRFTDTGSSGYQGAVIYNHPSSFMEFMVNSSSRMRITSDGKFGFNTTNPGAFDSGANNFVVLGNTSGTGNSGITIASGNDSYGNIYFGDGTGAASYRGYIAYNHNGNTLRFGTDGNERMRISSLGRVSIGSTTNTAKLSIWENASVNEPVRINDTNNTNAGTHRISFRTGDVEVGRIISSRSATSLVSGSDYRLKENVVDIADGISRVKQLLPKRFNFIVNADETVDGFIAHEAQAVVPEAVTGTYNEVDNDGKAVMQCMDQSKLVPLLTAALQEAIAKIETLEARVTTLEAG